MRLNTYIKEQTNSNTTKKTVIFENHTGMNGESILTSSNEVMFVQNAIRFRNYLYSALTFPFSMWSDSLGLTKEQYNLKGAENLILFAS